ncbi:unnamed protein product, partial [marine sediment metagenome]
PGFGTFTKAYIYSASGGASLILSTEGDLTSFSRIYDNGDTQLKIEKTTADGAGSSTIFINPLPQNSSSSAKIEFFRSTNTGGLRQFILYEGDGSNTVTMTLNAATGSITAIGTVQGNTITDGTMTSTGGVLSSGTINATDVLRADVIGPIDETDDTLIELATNVVTISGILLSNGLGVGVSPTSNKLINILATQDGKTSGEISNQGTDTGSYAGLFSTSDSGSLSILAHGSGRTATRQGITLGGRNEILSNGAELIIGTHLFHPVLQFLHFP